MLARARLPCKKLSRKMRCCGKLAGDPWSAPTHAIRQECNLLTVCYIISPSINKKAPTQPQNIYGWVGVVYL